MSKADIRRIQKAVKEEESRWTGRAKEFALAILACFAVRVTTGKPIEFHMRAARKEQQEDYQI